MPIHLDTARALDVILGAEAERLATEPWPSRVDDAFLSIMRAYRDADAAAREQLRSSLPEDARMLWVFAHRASQAAAVSANAELFLLSVLAHCIEDFRWDARENALRLDLIWNAAAQAGQSPAELFTEAAVLASERGRKELENLAEHAQHRKPRKRTRKARQ